MGIFGTDCVLISVNSVVAVNLYPGKINHNTFLKQNTICYKLSGASRHIFGDNELLLKKGGMLLIPKFAFYSVEVVQPGESVAIGFTLQNDTFPGNTLKLCSSRNQLGCGEIFLNMLRLSSVHEDHRYELMSLFFMLIAMIENEIGRIQIPPKLKAVVDYIDNHYTDQSLCVERLADVCGYSSNYLRRLFLRYFNMPPSRYIISHRMNQAMKLLKSGFFRIGEVAEMVGYSDVYYFSKSFRREFNVSPSEWLETHKQQ